MVSSFRRSESKRLEESLLEVLNTHVPNSSVNMNYLIDNTCENIHYFKQNKYENVTCSNVDKLEPTFPTIIDPNDLCVGSTIGRGNFGKVRKGVFRKKGTIDYGVEVAIKIPGKLNHILHKKVVSELLQFRAVMKK